MKKMIKLSFALLAALCIFAGSSKTSIEVSAWSGGFTCGWCRMPSYHATLVNTTYPNADNYNHQIKDTVFVTCDYCCHVWTETVYWSQRHSTPNNQACKCGFTPHR